MGVRSFLRQFYRVSDTPSEHEVYADQFTTDATFIMGSQKRQGTAGTECSILQPTLVDLGWHAYLFLLEIRQFREGMWTHVAARKHSVLKVFASSGGTPEVMLYGTVAYELKDGSKSSKDWAGRAILEESKGTWRFKLYQVYLVRLSSNYGNIVTKVEY
jgi:hypothetical protein